MRKPHHRRKSHGTKFQGQQDVGWDQRRFAAPAHHQFLMFSDDGPALEVNWSQPTLCCEFRLAIGVQINKALAEAAAVVTCGNPAQAWCFNSRTDNCVRGIEDGLQITAVDNDFHDRLNTIWNLRNTSQPGPQSGAEGMVRTREHERVGTPCF